MRRIDPDAILKSNDQKRRNRGAFSSCRTGLAIVTEPTHSHGLNVVFTRLKSSTNLIKLTATWY